ncbi:MAG: recombinase family protein [Rhizomicrobium sp.]
MSRRIGERVKATHAIQKAQGKRAGQPPLLPEKVRRRIVNERTKGQSLGATTDKLNKAGVPTASKSGRWYASTVSHVLRSVALDAELVKAGSRKASNR